MLLTVSHVSKAYPGLPVLNDVSFTVERGEIICLLGPSGVGKTTLLHIIAGLETPDTGIVAFEGRDLAGVPVHRRNFGLMFQDYALFPHKDVYANVAFGLRTQQRPAEAIQRRVREVLALVQLTGYENRRVPDLSGGEQQRVALARSLAPDPNLLMLDEPLGSLDRALREQLMTELRTILKRVGVTALYVTHDQQEAFTVADRVFIMAASPEKGGHVEQAGAPRDVYRQPATRFVAQFLGFRNLLDGTVVGPGDAGTYLVDTPLGQLQTGPVHTRFAEGQAVTVLIRPEGARLARPGASGINLIIGTLVNCSFRGSFYLLESKHSGNIPLTFEISTVEDDIPQPGDTVYMAIDPDAVTLLPPDHEPMF